MPSLAALLADPDEEIRSAAATALGWAGNRAGIEALLARATDARESAAVRGAAIAALGRIGDGSVVPVIEGLARDPDTGVRRDALLALIESPLAMRTDRVAAGVALLGDLEQDGNMRSRAAVALGAAKDPRAVEPLIKALEDLRPPKGYGSLPPPRAQTGQAKILAERLRSLHNLRAHAALALGQIGDQRAVPALLVALSDADPFVRMQSAAALGGLKAQGAVPKLIQALEDPDARVRLVATAVLGVQGDSAAGPALRRTLEDQDGNVRGQAARALGRLGDQGAREGLAKIAEQDPVPGVRQAARAALDLLGPAPEPKQ